MRRLLKTGYSEESFLPHFWRHQLADDGALYVFCPDLPAFPPAHLFGLEKGVCLSNGQWAVRIRTGLDAGTQCFQPFIINTPGTLVFLWLQPWMYVSILIYSLWKMCSIYAVHTQNVPERIFTVKDHTGIYWYQEIVSLFQVNYTLNI